MVKGAWVTLATNDSYSLGALVLAHSLKQVGTQKELAILVTPGVTNSMRARLSEVFNSVKEVNILDSKDKANLRLLQRPELGITFTKLHCWQLTEYEKCVFLDADTLVLQNCDELFDREELSAAPDVGWPDCFNSGVFVYRPSEETYNSLVQFALDKGSFDGGDQGLLNLYFSDWARKDISKHLPFIYNVCSTAFYSYLPAFKQFGKEIKIVHFIGNAKPWLQYFDTESKTVRPSRDLGHLEPILQKWWNIFCSMIHPNLSTDMISSYPSDPVSARPPDHFPQQPHIESPDPFDCTHDDLSVWDPWEEYDKRNESNVEIHFSEPLESHNTIALSPVASDNSCFDYSNPVLDEPFVDRNDQHYIDCSSNFEHYPNDQSCIQTLTESSPKEDKSVEENVSSFSGTHHECISHFNHETAQESSTTHPVPIHPEENGVSAIPTPCQTSSHENNPSHFTEFLPEVIPHEIIQKVPEETPSPPSYIPSKYETEEERDNVPCGVENEVPESGLAGAFARLTLGQQRTPEQEALEDCLRRQSWEQGNIDYLGRDSFDNIWSKICQTLAQGPQEEEGDNATQIKTDDLVPEPPQQQTCEVPKEDVVPSCQEVSPSTVSSIDHTTQKEASTDLTPSCPPTTESSDNVSVEKTLPIPAEVTAPVNVPSCTEEIPASPPIQQIIPSEKEPTKETPPKAVEQVTPAAKELSTVEEIPSEIKPPTEETPKLESKTSVEETPKTSVVEQTSTEEISKVSTVLNENTPPSTEKISTPVLPEPKLPEVPPTPEKEVLKDAPSTPEQIGQEKSCPIASAPTSTKPEVPKQDILPEKVLPEAQIPATPQETQPLTKQVDEKEASCKRTLPTEAPLSTPVQIPPPDLPVKEENLVDPKVQALPSPPPPEQAVQKETPVEKTTQSIPLTEEILAKTSPTKPSAPECPKPKEIPETVEKVSSAVGQTCSLDKPAASTGTLPQVPQQKPSAPSEPTQNPSLASDEPPPPIAPPPRKNGGKKNQSKPKK